MFPCVPTIHADRLRFPEMNLTGPVNPSRRGSAVQSWSRWLFRTHHSENKLKLFEELADERLSFLLDLPAKGTRQLSGFRGERRLTLVTDLQFAAAKH